MKGVAVLEEKPAVREAEATTDVVGTMRQKRAAAVVCETVLRKRSD
jgi:hypothetical protein